VSEDKPSRLEEAQRVTRERMANVSEQDLVRLHRQMHPDPATILEQHHAEQGDLEIYNDGSTVLYKPNPDGPADRFEDTQGVLHIKDGEEMFETRVYRTVPFADLTNPPFEIKFLAKKRIDGDGLVWWLCKFVRPNGDMFLTMNSKGWVPEASFRNNVEMVLAEMRRISAVSTGTVRTQADYQRALDAAHP
jgi:hypothetical protein